MRPIFVWKLLDNTTIDIGWTNNVGILKFVIKASVGVVVKIWKWFWNCALYLQENYLIILKLVLGEGIRQESRNLFFRPLLVSVVKIWKVFWKWVLYLQENYLIILKLVLSEEIRLESQKLVFYYWCLWLRYGSGFGNAPYICKKTT